MVNLLDALLVALGLISSDIDWCEMEKTYCEGNPHIACGENYNFVPSPGATNIQVLELSDAENQSLVDRHNYYRRLIAVGAVKHFPDAANMEKMTWNDVLAYLSAEQVKNAYSTEAPCRSYTDFPIPGQNRFLMDSPDPSTSTIDKFLTVIDEWFNTKNKMNTDDLEQWEKCRGISDCPGSHEFAQLAQADSDAVGCALSTFEQDGLKKMLFACTYATSVMLGENVYVRGLPCTLCPTRKACDDNLCA